ncbi:MAG: transcriptional repressor LexA [Proteobacteria bacterium]|nr:transcriptional repressor LexA [Pseudomonadota bacterium]
MLSESGLPIVGKVAAGEPVLAVEHIEDHLALDSDLFHPKPDYLLHVKGDSMRDAGIHEGDLLVVHRNQHPVNGQIVVARLDDDEVTVKRYKKNQRWISLVPENPDYEILRIDPRKRTIVIEGIVVGVLRRY